MNGLKYTPDYITHLDRDDVFVFGSNLAGIHAGGAARIAYEKFGAVMGQGVGLQGQSYAIPTMQGGVKTIKPYVDSFIDFARECDQNTFYVTRIGCGIAGFTDEQIAPLFEDALQLYNVRLPKSFVEIIYRNRERLIRKVLTPWPVRNYGVYNLFIDLLLANDADLNETGESGLGRRIESLRNDILSIRRSNHLIEYPDTELFHYLAEHRCDIVSGNNEKEILSVIGQQCEINHSDPISAAIKRFQVSQVYQVCKLIFRISDRSHKLSTGLAGRAEFETVFYEAVSGRWNGGDNSYMYPDMEPCLSFFCDEIKIHSSEITSNGTIERAKFLNFVAQPYILTYFHAHDGYAKHEETIAQIIKDIFAQFGYESEG